MAVPKRHLGRGLSALLGGDDGEPPLDAAMLANARTVPIEFLHPSKLQPRADFNDERLQQLAQSIRDQGVLQPILVRAHRIHQGEYEIVAGERRWRAAQLAQLHEVPVVQKDLSDRDTLEIALIENIQRQDLNPIEEARGYRRLMQEFAYTQEVLSDRIGKSRPHIANLLRLLELPDIVRTMIAEGKLSTGHARALINLPNAVALAEIIVAKGLSVREAERLATRAKVKTRGKAKKAPREKDADTKALERDLTQKLGLKVEIGFDGKGGAVTVHYQTLEQLDEIIGKLGS
jgi:ParB family transcriptional regulator, chromosome partitioning protein